MLGRGVLGRVAQSYSGSVYRVCPSSRLLSVLVDKPDLRVSRPAVLLPQPPARGRIAHLTRVADIEQQLEMGGERPQAEGEPAQKRQRTDGDGKGGRKGKGKGGGGVRDLKIPLMQHAAKSNNLKVAMTTFRECVAEGMTLPTSLINTLMYLACGGEQWERHVRGLPLLTTAEMEAQQAAAGAGEGAEGGDGEAAGGEEAGEQKQQQQQQQQQRKGKPNRVHVDPPSSPPTREELMEAMEELWSYVQSSGLKPDQGTYLALARREALKGDPAAALKWAKESGTNGRPMQLRLYHPAQVGFCLAKDVAALHDIDAAISAAGLDQGEYEYARLLEGIAAAGTYEQLRAALMRMQLDLNQLQPATAEHIVAFFERNDGAAAKAFLPPAEGGCATLAAALTGSSGAAEAAVAKEGAEAAAPAAEGTDGAKEEGAGSGGAGEGWQWVVSRGVAVAKDGKCEAAGGTLALIDLEEAEWESFANAIADLARNNMKRGNDFDAYIEWFNRNGPFDVLVDAANVAFFGQNHAGGGFCWKQVMAMYEMLRKKMPGKKILVMLHKKRLNDPEARPHEVQSFLEQLRRARSFYYTPPGANDDWYWLYACVRAKRAGLLVSNDELRDHIFSLLRPKHFLKWKQRHIAKYDFGSGSTMGGHVSFDLLLPDPYTACVQQLGSSGAWMVPITDGSWICVRPQRA